MMLTKCYCVVYHVADFSANGEFICHQDTYRDHNNALLVAKDLVKCCDIVDDVYVIDGLTGEVLNTILKDEPQEDTTEEDDAPVFTEEFDDGTGGMWRRANDGKWEYDCTGFGCSDCAYCGVGQLCVARRSTTTEDRDTQIKSAKERMSVKLNNAKEEKIPISNGIFDDGTGGVWQCIGNSKWVYNCLGLTCANCAYYNEDDCLVRDPMTEEERDTQIKSARKRMFVKTGETEEKENSSSNGIFDDGIGGVWKLTKNNTWSYNCKGLDCLDCAYYDEGHCSASGHVTKEERDILIKFAKAGMKK